MNKEKVLSIIIIILSLGVILGSIRDHYGVSFDSVYYIEGSNNIINGQGYVSRLVPQGGRPVLKDKPLPITHWPPLTSFMIAFFRVMGFAEEMAVRLYLMIFYSASMIVVWVIAKKILGRQNQAFIFVLFCIIQQRLVNVSSHAASESLYLFFSLLSLILINRYYKSKEPSNSLIIAISFFVSLSYLARYLGITLIVTGAIILLVKNMFSKTKKWHHVLLFLILPLLSFMRYSRGNSFFGGHLQKLTSIKKFMEIFEGFRQGLKEISIGVASQLLGLQMGICKTDLWNTTANYLILMLFLSIIFIFIWKRKSLRDKAFFKNIFKLTNFEKIILIYCSLYLIAIFVARETVFNRYFLMIQPLIFLLAISTIKKATKLFNVNYRLFIPLIIVIFSIQIFKTTRYLKYSSIDHTFVVHKNLGEAPDYESQLWRNDEVITFLNASNFNNPIYTNSVDFIFYKLRQREQDFKIIDIRKLKNKYSNEPYIVLIKARYKGKEYRQQLSENKRFKLITETKGLVLYGPAGHKWR